MARYKFTLNNGTQNRVCYPRWKADTAMEYAFETNQMFRRAQLTNSLVFVGSDYDWIMATSFEQKISVTISADWTESGEYSTYWVGSFHQTDCTINVDKKTISVKPNVEDRYNKILAGLDKEYDLIKLAPAIQPVMMVRRPMLQVYSLGESIVSCFLSGMSWEQDANECDNPSEMVNSYHFGRIGRYIELNMGTQPYFTNPFIGSEVRHSDSGDWNDFGSSSVYDMYFYQRHFVIEGEDDWVFGVYIKRRGQNDTIWIYSREIRRTTAPTAADLPDSFTMEAQVSGYNNLSVSKTQTDIYGRWVTADLQTGGSRIASDDIVAYNRNYKYCKPYMGEDSIVMTYNSSLTPTEWGLRSAGDYFAKPNPDANVLAYFPIARTSWINASLWFAQTAATDALEEAGRKTTQLRDAYTLEAVIKALLSVIDSSLSFEPTEIYSQFLYGQNPLITGDWGRLVMTPKSNVLVAEYTQPSQKAPITLGQVLDMLKKACGCYWYVNDSGQLRIEHIKWFKNGGSYTGTPAIGLDVTASHNTRNGKTLDFGTNEYTYDKIDMPARYQYSWADDTTAAFKGQAIEVLSTFVQEDKIEDITISGFNPDVDYMMLNPSSVSEDGFALLCCSVNEGVYSLSINTAQSLSANKMQNWQLSMELLQPSFLISDMPAWSIKVNGAQTTAKGIQRKKEQKIDIPVGSEQPNLQLMVQTGIGVGEIKTMSIKLSSRMAQTTLRYDTTQQ